MKFKEAVKSVVPRGVLRKYRQYWQYRHQQKLLSGMDPLTKQLYKMSALTPYDHVRLSESAEAARNKVLSAAKNIYGENWNYYSDALRPEIVQGFEASIDAFLGGEFTSINYLEIGSCQGLSMSLIGTLLKQRNMVGSLVSVDPYFESGYTEGESGPYRTRQQIPINKKTKALAQQLYSALSLPVEIIEATSLDGLQSLISNHKSFELIYVDGSHEAFWPAVDFGLSYSLLRGGGVVILDDHLWPDVQPIKKLCDIHGTRVQETWKTASYQLLK